ncbi:receptor-like protein 2 [Pyrus ussuriensis x Pyrus communis]|uniref:Receptor-like protein 2 n=1 Tax=Pyrus ussuriensis x Pyrus communis TaxID=2448454 RepID=A0A5N5FWD6_9ROSA|nr:receptor-like protein 2 [Pyrus ussuriensis x Pyrus communis]
MANFNGFQNLQMLDLSSCELNGEIPQWLSKLRKVGVLILSFNRITQSIPTLGGNRISGEFPKELCTLPMLLSEETAPQVDGDVLQYKLSYFPHVIDVKDNSISGKISNNGQLQLLQVLQL